MVDGITAGGGAAPVRGIPVATATSSLGAGASVASTGATSVATPASTPAPAAASQLAALAKAVAAAPPVDADRVQRIKTAIANGTFPILPATIADQMLSFRYEWMSHDQA